MNQTTIRVSTETREMLERLKVIPQEPLDAVIKRIAAKLAAGCDDEGVVRPRVNALVKRRLRQSSWLDVEDARAMATGSGKRGGKRVRQGAKKPRSGSR